MASARDMRLRIRSIKNIAQVTRALEAVSASKVNKAVAQVEGTRPYASKAWQVLKHVAMQPGRETLHPLLTDRTEVKKTLVLLLSSDRGLAGAYNTNVIRFNMQNFGEKHDVVDYITVGKKGRDLIMRRGGNVMAEFSDLPAAPSFMDVSAIGHLAVEKFLEGEVDEVYLVYTDYVSMAKQVPVMKKLLPLEVDDGDDLVQEYGSAQKTPAAYIYEPSAEEILDEIIPNFTALQVYQAVLESLASEHAARMVAMRNATDNAHELVGALQLEYNKVRQQTITGDILDIAGGAEALAQS
ncbi:MAG: ATP synthase F1 subunit gamma [Anaerolineae bacterium]|jgi:F-type H+-transporting ATPase subunit gamma|nr:ATP synthase F1 subunit gamma [Anaerolineae bacterium]MBT7189462.1 ATP synthase F1 subunit gamma [Anaerolineae bacterium]MBT7991487.1 ATP synthase F1 subunit gamma [Anaerolineae bacterium]